MASQEIFLPHPALRPFVSHYDFVLPNSESIPGSVPPQLSSGFSFCEFLDSPLLASNRRISNQAIPESFIIPVHSESYIVDFQRFAWAMGIHFLPGKFFEFFGWPQDLFPEGNPVRPEETDLGKDFRVLKEQVFESATKAQKIASVESFLLRHFPETPSFRPAMDFVLNQFFESGGQISIPGLVKKTGMSKRHFRRVFREHIGLPASTFMRIFRFYQGFWRLQSGRFRSLTEIAHDAGYFDQAHFIHDFKEYTGMTPSEFLQFHPVLTECLAWGSTQEK